MQANGKAKQLLDAVQAKLGMTPNMVKAMAQSPAVLEGYLSFSGALAGGQLSVKLREQIALAVAQANQCEYCLAAHSALGKMAGLSEEKILASRYLDSADGKVGAALRFAQEVVVTRGEVSDDGLARLRAAGFADSEVAEIIANVALNIFTNYFNRFTRTDVDFPKVSLKVGV